MSELPNRPSASDVEAAIYRIQHPTCAPNITAEVIVRELLHLRECIEKCKSVQRVNEAAADEWQADADKHLELGSARVRAIVYREVAAELAKALEGF